MSIDGISGKVHNIIIREEDIKPQYRKASKSTENTSSISTVDKTLYQTFNTWGNNIHTKANEAAVEAALQYTDPMLGDELYDKNYKEIYNHTYAENAYTDENIFDMAQGKTIDSKEKLFQLYDEMAKGHIATYDTNNDGKISLEEMAAGELEDYNQLYADEGEPLSLEDPGVAELFSASHNFFDLNGDGYIDTDETKAYYTVMDALYDDNGMDGKVNFYSYRTMSTISEYDPEVDDNAYRIKSTMITAYNKYFNQ